METWPNFFIVGAQKCGTTSLWEYLRLVPQVYMSTVKEPFYFTTELIPNDNDPFFRPIRDKIKYLELFKEVTDEIAIGEATAINLPDSQAPKNIHNLLPESKIVIILRNPTERVYSHYLHYFRMGWDTLSFDESIKINSKQLGEKINVQQRCYIELSLYENQVKRYLDIFGKDKVKVIIFEELIKDTDAQVNSVLKFLDIQEFHANYKKAFNTYREPKNKITQSIMSSKVINQIIPKLLPLSSRQKIIQKFLLKKGTKQKMSEENREFLNDIFKEDVEKLEKILNKKLPWGF